MCTGDYRLQPEPDCCLPHINHPVITRTFRNRSRIVSSRAAARSPSNTQVAIMGTALIKWAFCAYYIVYACAALRLRTIQQAAPRQSVRAWITYGVCRDLRLSIQSACLYTATVQRALPQAFITTAPRAFSLPQVSVCELGPCMMAADA